jgi:lipocalin-like protein
MGLGGSVQEGHAMSEMRERLIGAWTLVSYVLLASDGSEPIHPLGTEARGFIMYTPDGYMSAQIMRTGRPAFASGNPVRAAGLSLFPNWIDVDQVRRVAFDGDLLTLSTVTPTPGRGREFAARLTWRRAVPN